MKRKGFTLVELLTVIAILAIILLIASPIILNVLEKAKQNTFKNQVLLYVEGIKQQAVLSGIGEGNIVLPSNDESIDIDVSTINLEIDKNYTGKIRITNTNGKYEYTLIDVTGDGYTANGPINKIVVTKAGKDPEPPKKTSFVIGDQVTLKDNSVWYVIENSGSSSDTVTLFASSNIKNDASGWTTTLDEYYVPFDIAYERSTENNSYCISPQYGCNIYEAQSEIITNDGISGTVTEDSTIKKFLVGDVAKYINDSLTSNGGINIKSIRLISVQEICNIINASDNSNNCIVPTTDVNSLSSTYSNVPKWLYSTNYWTSTPYSKYTIMYISSSSGVYHRYAANSSNLYPDNVITNNIGARPVIVINKSNIE